ncbi:transferase [Calothrix sp. NIES-3974]|uniref:transferase n=1 Tax=Calothrix sp. NIES-3974 TaxID=2005462 RepID=UPI000B60F6DF|nr:transferase [Calothrix sp. NIES-3974]BAZ04660.1 transferase hexapeptide repeat protein [Calothrix sp. NIES-3974]
MAVPPLRLGSRFESYISGEVIVDESAVLAPGVIIRAGANGKITIGAGVCVGMGTILQVENGIIQISPGANLGAGVLMIGAGTIGENACIGAATTLYNASVEPAQIIPPGSMLGDIGRPYSLTSSADDSVQANPQKANGKYQLPDVWEEGNAESATSGSSQHTQPEQTSTPGTSPSVRQDVDDKTPSSQPSPDLESENADPAPNLSTYTATGFSETFGTQIYGQTSVQRLLTTLFPHRQPLNKPVSDNESE